MVTGIIRLAHLGHPHGHAAVDLHVKQLVLPGSQSLVQSDRLIAAPTVIHPVTGLDNLHRFLSGSQLLLIQFLNIHPSFSSIFIPRKVFPCIVKILSYSVRQCKQNVKKITILQITRQLARSLREKIRLLLLFSKKGPIENHRHESLLTRAMKQKIRADRSAPFFSRNYSSTGASSSSAAGASRARMDREIFCFSSSIAVILASTVWPSERTSSGFSMRRSAI